MFKALFRTFSFTLKRMFEYGGRSCREEYWYFLIASFVFHIPVWIVAAIAGETAGPWVILAYQVIIGLGFLSLQSRRLHDLGYPSYWLGLYLVPITVWLLPVAGDFLSLQFMYTALVGAFMGICLWLKGVSGDNKFGEDPLKEEGASS